MVHAPAACTARARHSATHQIIGASDKHVLLAIDALAVARLGCVHSCEYYYWMHVPIGAILLLQLAVLCFTIDLFPWVSE